MNNLMKCVLDEEKGIKNIFDHKFQVIILCDRFFYSY